MADLHPDHVAPVICIEGDFNALSSLVIESYAKQLAAIVRKLANDLGHAQQANEALRVKAASEVQTARKEALREAADKCDAWAEISARLGLHDARVRAFKDAAANLRAALTGDAHHG